jgi:hypothetical protein
MALSCSGHVYDGAVFKIDLVAAEHGFDSAEAAPLRRTAENTTLLCVVLFF